ncbi:MAG: F0F1 ATP synthase subunit A [Pseudomonadota bacterium]
MGEHSTWFDFLNALPGWQNLCHTAEHYLGRHWRFAMFEDTHFTLTHVLELLLVSLFLIVGAVIFHGAVRRGDRDAIVPPPRFNVRNLFEMFAEAVFSVAQGVMGKHAAERYLPLIGALALTIFFSNALALIPGFIPPTDTLKTNLALSGTVFLATHIYGVREHGLKYFKHFLGPIWWPSPLMLPIELISHLARPASLALRLMGNMASDHKVVAAFFVLIPPLVPVPFLVLGLLVVIVQTFVFTLLTMVYISMAVAHEEHH